MVENEHLSWDSWINKKYIVIHHTATRSDLTASQMSLSMKRTWIDNRKMSRIPTTFIVDSKWNYIQVNKIDEDVWACIKDRYNTTWQVIECNQYWIHIELVWDFNKSKPTEKQYEWLSRLIMYLQNKNKNLIVKYHSDFQTKNCPWKRFDKFKILNMIWLTDWEYKYSLSRYYSPEQWQLRYYRNDYKSDVIVNCWKDAIWNDWCSYPANWIKLKESDAWNVVACPSEFELWHVFHINWMDYTCVDRWWAIIKEWNIVRLDIRMWYWDKWLNNILQK